MPGYAAFLRAINLGRNRRVDNAELRSRFEELGLRNVATFRASGNLVFDADGGSEAELTARIEAGLEESLGYEVGTFVRTAAEVRAIAAHEPFSRGLVEASRGKLQVAILAERPAKRAREAVLALASADDRLAFGDRELYWLPSGGTLESELNAKAIEQLAGPMTIRTKGTVEQMAAKHFAD